RRTPLYIPAAASGASQRMSIGAPYPAISRVSPRPLLAGPIRYYDRVMARIIRRLEPADADVVASLLDRDPVQNAYLGSELRLHGLRAGTWWGVGNADRVEAIVLGGSLVV